MIKTAFEIALIIALVPLIVAAIYIISVFVLAGIVWIKEKITKK